MPDLLLVLAKRWKLILTLTLLATFVAAISVLLSPKKYLSVVTALAASTATADKARVFNPNIEGLYSDFGSPDELERIEGTAALDTIFLAASKELQLAGHYSTAKAKDPQYQAAMELKANAEIRRSSYGELKIKVWDEDKNRAADLANFLVQKLQEIHQHLQNETNVLALKKINDESIALQSRYVQLTDSLSGRNFDSLQSPSFAAKREILKTKMAAVSEQLLQYEKIIGQYNLAIKTPSPVLLIVERARPAVSPDKPKILPTVLFAFFGSLLFSFLLALFIESRKHLA